MTELFKEIDRYQHIIWDWNGTLLYDLPHAVKTVNVLLHKRQLPLLTEEKYKQEFRFPVRDYYVSLGFDLEKESFASLCDEFVDLYMSGVYDCGLVEGAEELLKKIKSKGKLQSILSATDQENLDRMMKHFSLSAYLDYAYGIADKLAASKVQRGHELLAKSGSQKTQTVLIGDTDHDFEVGNSLGIDVILVDHGHQEVARLKKAHSRVMSVLIRQ